MTGSPDKVFSVHIGQVYLERGYGRHFKVRAIEGDRAVVSSCMADGSEFRSDGSGVRTRIQLKRLVRSPYILRHDPSVTVCPTCNGEGTVPCGKVSVEHTAACADRFESEDHDGAPIETTSCGCECHE